MASPGDVFDAGKPIVVPNRTIFPVIRAGKAQPRVSSKPPQQILEIIRLERHVAIQVPDQVGFRSADSRQSRIERVHFAGEVALGPLGHPHQLDPVMKSHVSLNDLVSPIGRAVADDHPFDWPDRLSDDGFDGRFDMSLFVARRRYQDVGQLRRSIVARSADDSRNRFHLSISSPVARAGLVLQNTSIDLSSQRSNRSVNSFAPSHRPNSKPR